MFSRSFENISKIKCNIFDEDIEQAEFVGIIRSMECFFNDEIDPRNGLYVSDLILNDISMERHNLDGFTATFNSPKVCVLEEFEGYPFPDRKMECK